MLPLCFILFKMEQVEGIEPSTPAWKAGVLPLNYTCMVAEIGFAPMIHGYEPCVITTSLFCNLKNWYSVVELNNHDHCIRVA